MFYTVYANTLITLVFLWFTNSCIFRDSIRKFTVAKGKKRITNVITSNKKSLPSTKQVKPTKEDAF